MGKNIVLRVTIGRSGGSQREAPASRSNFCHFDAIFGKHSAK